MKLGIRDHDASGHCRTGFQGQRSKIKVVDVRTAEFLRESTVARDIVGRYGHLSFLTKSEPSCGIPGEPKKTPTTFVDITAMHGNFCTKFYTIVKRLNIHFITKFY